jgi:hypothetical protein
MAGAPSGFAPDSTSLRTRKVALGAMLDDVDTRKKRGASASSEPGKRRKS